MQYQPAKLPEAFRSTIWADVQMAGRSESPAAQVALEKLCHTYWYPLYAYVRRQGYAAEQAQDLTQEFFYRVLQKQYFSAADPARGRFRAFLLASLKNFLAKEWQSSQAQKRGGGATIFSLDAASAEERYQHEPAVTQTPETIYEQRWAYALLEQVLVRLREEFAEADKTERFEELSAFLLEDAADSQAEIGARLGLSESAVKSAVHRLRQRYGELLREEIAKTVSDPGEVEAEIRLLLAVFAEK